MTSEKNKVSRLLFGDDYNNSKTLVAKLIVFTATTSILVLSILVLNQPIYAEEIITNVVKVDGHSMEPTFNDKSLVFQCDAVHCPFSDLKEGDIISFHSEKDKGVDILHRIYEVNHYDEDGSIKDVETVGDNPIRPWYETVNSDMYIGKIVVEQKVLGGSVIQ